MNHQKCVLIILDGLNYETACKDMGFLLGMTEYKMACLNKMICELPSSSRPLYEAILTGVPPLKSGITNNNIIRKSYNKSIFSQVRLAGKTTASASYFWNSELYIKAPYHPDTDRFTFNNDGDIQNGIFYHEDSYPDSHLFLDAQYLISQYEPDFIHIHSMNIDNIGHKHGSNTSEYRNVARAADGILAVKVPQWLKLGYSIIVTSDHGMTEDNGHAHNGLRPSEREVPFFFIPNQSKINLPKDLKQIQIATFVCSLMGIDPASTMATL